MFGRALRLATILVLVLSGYAFAGEGEGRVAGRFDSYLFSLSWQPAFCEQHKDKKECKNEAPGRYDANNLVLHGLWPNKDGDKQHTYGFCGVDGKTKNLDKASTWCKMPDIGISDDTKADLAVYMPGFASCLQNHEWYKHGSCSGYSPDEYFQLADSFVKEVAATNFGKLITANVGRTVNKENLLLAFESDFGPGSRASVNLVCDKINGQTMLTEVHMALTNPLPPGAGVKDALLESLEEVQGGCPAQVYIDPVGKSGQGR